MEPEEIDTTNAQLVGADGAGSVLVQMPAARMTRQQALTHAAWLVLMARGEDEFPAVLNAVRNT